MPSDGAVPLRDYIQRVVGGGTPARSVDAFWNGTIPWASVKDFTEGESTLWNTQEHLTERGVAASATNVIPAGTPIICTRMAVGRIALTTQDTAINQDVKALIPGPNLDAKFLVHLLSLKRPQLEAVAIGSTVKGITLTDLLSVPWLPILLPEQRRIAEILDTLDRTIESTQRIIEKLQATRQGLLHDLLTRGLDEHGQLRDPERNPEQFKETELGKLPREWEVKTLGEACSLIRDGTHLPPKRVASGPLLLSVQNMIKGEFVLTAQDTHVSWDFFRQMHSSWQIQPGDALLAVVGATLGKTASVPFDMPPFTLQRSVAVMRGAEGVLDSNFLRLWLQSPVFQIILWAGVNQTAQPGIYLNQLADLILPVPNVKEQERIIRTLTASAKKISTEHSALDKLQALKRGLMDDLLTGRVRVPVTVGEAVSPPAAPAPVAQQDAHSTIPFDRAPLAPVVNFRAAPGASSVAQADWVAQARTLAARQQPAPYSPEALDRAAAQLAGLSVEPEGILQVPDVLRQAGVRFVLLKHPKGSKTSGAAFWLDDACRAEPVVALSMRYPLVDVFWFNLFHELGHIRHGHAAVLGEVLEPGSYRSDDAAESEANAYAREALIPDAVWQPYLESGNHSSRGLRAFARQVGRHHATVAGRLGHDLRDFPRFNSRELRPSVPTELFERLVLRLGGSV